ncbi:MAG: gliding motility-associated C-terminal domain-containing protein [Flavobacteriales bacterium]|nr:gliding motility-associated C-terminal domain-containing protein [Flavobacteriales bacterium]MBP6697046.1 gliding motility-associated C-terminal domain-containing protein [Flavobacteriales bacterium]
MVAPRSFRSLALVAGSLIASAAHAQTYWSQVVRSTGIDHVSDLVVDGTGATYITGEFSATALYDGQSFFAVGGTDFFAAKLDASGALVWWQQGGGTGLDRGLRLTLGPNNTLTVVGQFMATADFQGETLTSQGGSVDLFVCQLNAADGTQQWIKSGGGLTGFDRPADVSVSSAGQIVVTGEFRDAFTFNGASLISTIDPFTQLPGTDVFISAMAPDGTPLWNKQGVAPRDDAAVAITHDASGAIYATGQFSDTITFDLPHFNTWNDAIFLMKLDAAGVEQWFRRSGGGILNQGRDLLWRAPDDLVLLGSVRGIMSFEDGNPDQVSSFAQDSYFLLRADVQGTFEAATVMPSDGDVDPTSLATVADTLIVLGDFECQFTGLSDLYDDGLFLAVGIQDIFISKHRYSDLDFLEAQQIGGRGEKRAGRIAAKSDGHVFFCGSFDELLVFPSNGDMAAEVFTPTLAVSPQPAGYCGDPHYGTYAANIATGLRDGFIAKGWVWDRTPYDIWERTSGPCDRSQGRICIGQSLLDPWWLTDECVDFLQGCGRVTLSFDTTMSVTLNQPGFDPWIGPATIYLWSNGATTDTTTVFNSGDYTLTTTFGNGCLQLTDTITVNILPTPEMPLISDSHFVNFESPPLTGTIILCEGDSVYIASVNVPVGPNSYWFGPDSVPMPGSGFSTDTAGHYTFINGDPSGCYAGNSVDVVILPPVPIPPVDLQMDIDFPLDTDHDDTIVLCGLGLLELWCAMDWTLNGQPWQWVDGLTANVIGMGLFQEQLFDTASFLTAFYPTQNTGWLAITTDIYLVNWPCHDSLEFHFTDSIYLIFADPGPPDAELLVPPYMCPDDSIWLIVDCPSCYSFWWVGQQFDQLLGDSAQTHVPGYYGVEVTAQDTNGCPSITYLETFIYPPLQPNVFVVPEVICPNDSVMLYTDVFGTYAWYGPNGQLPDTGSFAYVDEPGLYYVEVTMPEGCFVQSVAVKVLPYQTPYLNLIPDAVLCDASDSTLLQVNGSVITNIAWQAPLSGNDLVQVVYQPGQYVVQVTSCAITTFLIANITESDVEAILLTTGQQVLCPGDSVLLQVVPQGGPTEWAPGGLQGDSVVVGTTGIYTATVTDESGCTAVSDPVEVLVRQASDPPAFADVQVCVGQQATLNAQGNGTITWFDDPSLQDTLGTGSTITMVPSPPIDSVFVSQNENGCPSAAEVVYVTTTPEPDPPILDGPWNGCLGQTLLLNASGPNGATFTWSTPNGIVTGTPLILDPLEISDAGIYSCLLDVNGCLSPADSALLQVSGAAIIDFATQTACFGGPLVLTLGEGYSEVVWSTGDTATAIMVFADGYYSVQAVGPDGCLVAGTMQVVFELCELIIPNIFSPNGDGSNDAVDLTAPAGWSIGMRIFNRWGQRVAELDGAHVVWNGRHGTTGEPVADGTYFYTFEMTHPTVEMVSKSGTIQVVH